MAYTIISQNNSTTTLSDGVNTITVPSRVNLTSGNFTIVEVNNNMATLEDGDGNVYRDIPCVATLAGEGGGGSSLPDQTGHSGEFLTTDGTDASWAAVDALPDQTGNSGKFLTTDGTSASWGIAYSYNSYSATWGTATGSFAIGLGDDSQATGPKAVAIGQDARGNGSMALALGYGARVTANNAIQLNTSGIRTNSDASTFKVGNVNGNYEIMSADGTIPTARFTTDPVSDGTYYPTLTISSGTPTRSWSTIAALQNTATGTDSLTILGTAATQINSINIGVGSSATGANSTVVGKDASASGNSAVAIGINASATNTSSLALVSGTVSGSRSKGIGTSISGKNSIGITTLVNHTGTMSAQYTVAIGTFNYIDNLDNNSFYVGLGTSNADYKLLSSDGTIPTARLTKVNTTVTLAAADWSGGSQTVTVTGMTATGIALVSPDPTDQAAYTSAGIICTAQAADSLTFTATTTPSGDIDVNVVML